MEKEVEFQGFPKVARLNRKVIITEKIDGTMQEIADKMGIDVNDLKIKK
jgi:hypothetical protein